MRQAISVPRANLISLGICLGKFSKTEKFRLHVTGLDLLGRYAKNKVCSHSGVSRADRLADQRALSAQIWIKPNGEMPFLYGNHVVKAHLGQHITLHLDALCKLTDWITSIGRITEDTPEHQGVVVFSMTDVPLVSGPYLAVSSESVN